MCRWSPIKERLFTAMRRGTLLSTLICLSLFLIQCVPAAYGSEPPAIDAEYRELTKQVLLELIDLERFSLKYRRDSAKQPFGKRLRYFLAQETGAATGLAYECIAIDQLKDGRKNPLRIDPDALEKGLRTVLVGAVIAGAGSGLELSSNALLAARNYKKGIDSRSANKYMLSGLTKLDGMLTEREGFVNQHSDHPHFKQAMLEGKILRWLRQAVVHEYIQFHKDVRGFRATENVFYAMNIATNVVSAVSAHHGIKGLEDADHNGPANILFTVAGALTIASPIVSTTVGRITENVAFSKLRKQLNADPKFDYEGFKKTQSEFAESLNSIDENEATAAVYRAGQYLEGSTRSRQQMISEFKVMHYLDQVAVENAVIGPAIGGTLLGQGIAGTVGFYKYHGTLKELDLSYKGSVAGAVGTGSAVGFTALGLAGDWYYERKLSKKGLLPKQLIEKRLIHLDDVEMKVAAM